MSLTSSLPQMPRPPAWGILAKQGRICEYFHDEITTLDYTVLNQTASSSGQQAFECLAILVALRH
eukprot:3298971-Amphidinium_carterae.1